MIAILNHQLITVLKLSRGKLELITNGEYSVDIFTLTAADNYKKTMCKHNTSA